MQVLGQRLQVRIPRVGGVLCADRSAGLKPGCRRRAHSLAEGATLDFADNAWDSQGAQRQIESVQQAVRQAFRPYSRVAATGARGVDGDAGSALVGLQRTLQRLLQLRAGARPPRSNGFCEGSSAFGAVVNSLSLDNVLRKCAFSPLSLSPIAL